MLNTDNKVDKMNADSPVTFRRAVSFTAGAATLALTVLVLAAGGESHDRKDDSPGEGAIRCARISYNNDKSSKCYSAGFLDQVMQDTYIKADRKLASVRLESSEMFQYPFVVMTGEEPFKLTDRQRANMRDYLRAGGFLVASAACGSEPWGNSLKAEVRKAFPDLRLTRLAGDHPVFHTIYNVARSRHTRGAPRPVHLEALLIDGRIALVYSPDGINDTAGAGGDCCCCGGSEIRGARQINAILLAYALTH